MPHRFKAIREELGITQPKMAELLGGDSEGWYTQRVERLENGKTKLTDEDAWHISERLGIPVYAIFVDPRTIIDEKDREIISRYHAASENEKITVRTILKMQDKLIS